MGEIRINIPEDVEKALERAFPGEDKAAAILRLIEAEIANYGHVPQPSNSEPERKSLVEQFREFRRTMPVLTEEEFHRLREEGRP